MIASVSSTLGLVIKVLHSLTFIDLDIHIGVFGSDTMGVIIFFALLSFALGDKINILKQEKESAQEKALETLEEKVKERTAEVVEQKHIIEEKHKEITDSINYAERIQRSFLATKEMLDENLNASLRGGTREQSQNADEIAALPLVARNDDDNYFVLFKPKDVVSGDFYWASSICSIQTADSSEQLPTLDCQLFYLATADSTGHGVPGAIMSLLNITSLEKAIESHADPGEILNATRKTIIERLKKDGSEHGGKDGMDCSLLCFDFKNNILKLAAANNPVWIVRTVVSSTSCTLSTGSGKKTSFDYVQDDVGKNGVVKDYALRQAQGDAKELIEIKPDKMPVGKHDKDHHSFTTHTIQLHEGDVIYTLTDGFPDQFGGEHGKKFMSKKLKEVILEHSYLPMKEQKQLLEETFNKWIGNLEQVDDVCVIGITL